MVNPLLATADRATVDDRRSIVIGLALGWLSLAVGLLAWGAARRWWRSRRYGPPIDHSGLLLEVGRRLTRTMDRQALARLLTDELPRTLDAERSVLLVSQEHRLVAAGPPHPDLPVSHAAVRRVASGGQAQRTDRGRVGELVRQGRIDLAWTRVWVPLARGVDLRGMWLLGRRKDGRHYSPEDLRWLTAVAREAAAVLEAIRYAEQERRSASEMRALYRQVVAARETERGRLSRELHDGVLQDMCAVTRDLKALEAQGEPGTASLAGRSGEAVHALRAICNDLRPPLLQRDLTLALRGLVEEMDARSPAPVHLEVAADDLHVEENVALALFRITQEALRNAIQHADASEVAVRLTRYPDRLRLTVTDDGRGIEGGVEPGRFVAQGHFGLAGMRERAAMIGGKLEVQTAVDYGTVVIFELAL